MRIRWPIGYNTNEKDSNWAKVETMDRLKESRFTYCTWLIVGSLCLVAGCTEPAANSERTLLDGTWIELPDFLVQSEQGFHEYFPIGWIE